MGSKEMGIEVAETAAGRTTAGGTAVVLDEGVAPYRDQVTAWPEPQTEAERFTPYLPVKNVTPDYPSTFMVHGTNDTDVPYDQSQMMAEQFKRHEVPYLLISIPNGEHGLGGGDPKLIDDGYAKAFEFVDKRLQRPKP